LSSAGSDCPGWEIRRVSLAFRIGEAPVFHASLRLWAPTPHFLEVDRILDAASLPEAVRRSDTDGAFLRSHPSEQRMPRLRIRGCWMRYCPARYRRYLAELGGTHQEYLSRFSSKTRSTLLRKVRRFREASGEGESFRAYRDPAELREFHRLARMVSAKTYQERLLDSGLPEDEAFRRQMEALAAEDRVRAFMLFLGPKPVAYLYAPAAPDSRVLLYQYLGYDPEHASLSPGTVLQYLAMERLIEEGTWVLFDFLEGETQEKRQFATRSVSCADLYFLRLSVRNIALVLGHTFTESTSDTASWILERAGVKRALKRWIRRTAGGRPAPGSPASPHTPDPQRRKEGTQ
jgi:hypothetical protein